MQGKTPPLIYVQCVWVVNTQYPHPPYRVFVFVAQFFPFVILFLVTRFMSVFEKTFFDGGVKHSSGSYSIHDTVR